MRAILLAITLLAPTVGTSGEVFKWRDSKGVIHFSNQPRDLQYQTGSDGQDIDDSSIDSTKNIDTLDDRASYCHSLSAFLSALSGDADIVLEVKGFDGQYQELSAEDRQAEAIALQEEFDSYCQ